MKNICVIGNGLAALGILENLSQEANLSLTWIAPFHKDFGSCSLNSTAVVALQGISRGLSPLGDTLYEAYFYTRDFFEEEKPRGVFKGERYHATVLQDEDKLNERFGGLSHFSFRNIEFNGVKEEVYVIEPQSFISWWTERILKRSVKQIDDFLVGRDIDGDKFVLNGLKENYLFDLVVDARGSGAVQSFERDQAFVKESSLPVKAKKVVGHYYAGPAELGEFSWVFTLDGHNLIYRHHAKELVLGGSSEKDEILAPRLDKLMEMKETFLQFFKDDTQLIEALQHLELQKAGVRVKASKRRPVNTFLDDSYYVLNGFYKNGYSLGPYLGQKAAQEIKNHLKIEKAPF